MSEAAALQNDASDGQLPAISFPARKASPDLATIIGILGTFVLIIAGILLGNDAEFINVPSILIVVCGTFFATMTSYTVEEIRKSGSVIGKAVYGSSIDPKALANSLLDAAVVAKKKGVLVLSQYDGELSKDPFLHKSIQLVIDGYPPEDIAFVLTQELDSEVERHKRSAGITRRASEIAPAMGLIGTLIGLVQMLANLENPDSIGGAMAVALLTTFYGAILGTIVMAPLAVKLEKRSSDDALAKTMITMACISIAKQENPRKLEMQLNAELPPSKRVRYFD